MRYEWDERKNLENQRKHDGISFELATLAFQDENRLVLLDRVDETGEQRWLVIGAVTGRPGKRAILVVAHVYRYWSGEEPSHGAPREDHDGEEIIRIISARAAGKSDIGRYQEQAVD